MPNMIPYTHANTQCDYVARHPKTVGKDINMQKKGKSKGGWLVDSAKLAINIPSMPLSINDRKSLTGCHV